MLYIFFFILAAPGTKLVLKAVLVNCWIYITHEKLFIFTLALKVNNLLIRLLNSVEGFILFISLAHFSDYLKNNNLVPFIDSVKYFELFKTAFINVIYSISFKVLQLFNW